MTINPAKVMTVTYLSLKINFQHVSEVYEEPIILQIPAIYCFDVLVSLLMEPSFCFMLDNYL